MENINQQKDKILSDVKTALNLFKFYDTFYQSLNGNAKSYLQSQSKKYKKILSDIQEIILPHVNKICPKCDIQCCKIYNPKSNSYIYKRVGFFECVDYLLVKCDTDLPEPLYANVEKNLCLFFKNGCILPVDCRSWTCIEYFCDNLKNEINMAPISKYLEDAESILKDFSLRECLM